MVEGCAIPEGFYIPSTTHIGPDTDLSAIARVTIDASEFSEDVVRANQWLVHGYKRIANEL